MLMPAPTPTHVGDWVLLGRAAPHTRANCVFHASHTLTSHGVSTVAKLVDLAGPNAREAVRREAEIMGRVGGHANIITLVAVATSPRFALVVTELGSSDLRSVLDTHREQGLPFLPRDTARMYSTQLLRAVCFLHDNAVVHRDLKLANCVLARPSGDLQVIDFDCAIMLDGPGTTAGVGAHTVGWAKDFAGTLGYMAPEAIDGKLHGKPADVWSFAVCLFELACGFPPFRSTSLADYKCDCHQASYKDTQRQQQFARGVTRPQVPTTLQSTFEMDLFQLCPDKRITAQQLLATHPWFAPLQRLGSPISYGKPQLQWAVTQQRARDALALIGTPPAPHAPTTPLSLARAATPTKLSNDRWQKARANVHRLAVEQLYTQHNLESGVHLPPLLRCTKSASLPRRQATPGTLAAATTPLSTSVPDLATIVDLQQVWFGPREDTLAHDIHSVRLALHTARRSLRDDAQLLAEDSAELRALACHSQSSCSRPATTEEATNNVVSHSKHRRPAARQAGHAPVTRFPHANTKTKSRQVSLKF